MIRAFVLFHLLHLAVAGDNTPHRFGRQRPQNQRCKPIPGSTDWPAQADWQALNSSVSGRLFAASPPGAVCHSDWPVFNSTDCGFVSSQWGNTSYHTSDLLSVDYNDVTCFPSADSPCTAAGYPNYVIAAQTKEDVQAGVNFARETGVRLVVKGTGHNYPGRSSGSNSLLINTHGIRGLELNRNDPAATALGGVASVKIYAGEQMRNVIHFATENNITLVGGADPDVGIGGWISAGGHSPISARYGMGADQAIAFEVVTADGVFRTVDESHDSDLFWALRGGGSGTFAVLISVTVRAHPSISVVSYLFTYATTNNSDTFWDFATYFHTELPRLGDAGLMGYYWLYPDTHRPNQSTSGIINGIWIAPEQSIEQVKAIIEPQEAHLRSSPWADAVQIQSSYTFNENFERFWDVIAPADVGGYGGRLGSRLWGNDTLNGDLDELKDALKISTPTSEVLLGHLVAGPGPRCPPGGIAGGDNAVLPAWRESYIQVIAPRAWTGSNATQIQNITEDLRNIRTPALEKVAPDSGAYINEADPTDPNWKVNFFGDHYPRLLAIKRRWDPHGVFWCKACVGSDLWDAVGPYGVENGVGQSVVQLCRSNATRTHFNDGDDGDDDDGEDEDEED